MGLTCLLSACAGLNLISKLKTGLEVNYKLILKRCQCTCALKLWLKLSYRINFYGAFRRRPKNHLHCLLTEILHFRAFKQCIYSSVYFLLIDLYISSLYIHVFYVLSLTYRSSSIYISHFMPFCTDLNIFYYCIYPSTYFSTDLTYFSSLSCPRNLP